MFVSNPVRFYQCEEKSEKSAFNLATTADLVKIVYKIIYKIAAKWPF